MLGDFLKKATIVPGRFLRAGDTLAEAIAFMEEYELDRQPVVGEDGKLKGVVTRSSILGNICKMLPEAMLADFFLEDCADAVCEENSLKNLSLAEFKIPRSDLVLVNEQGKITGIISLKLLTKLLYRRFREMRAIFDSALNGIIILDKEGYILEMNPAAEKITGLIRQKTIGRRPEQRGLPMYYLNALEKGRQSYESRFTYKGRVFIGSQSPIIIDNKIEGVVGIFQEITQLENVVNKLSYIEDLKKQLETIINSSYDGIIVSDTEGNILNMNVSAQRMIEKSEHTGNGENSSLKKLPGDILTLMRKILLRKNSETCVIKNYKGNDLIITGTPLFDDSENRISKFIFNIRDITELNLLRRELNSVKELNLKYLSELDKIKSSQDGDQQIITQSKKMQQVIDISLRVANVDSTVLILGESGVGKQLIAELIHKNSNRKNGPFIEINCGSIPETLLESEFFGYAPGTFTGGLKNGKAGIFEAANGGTIFLDEIGDLPYALQVKLLKVLQNQEVTRLGSSRPRKVNVRIIAATNKNLDGLVEKGLFREDLFYRLNVVPITIPPLRERKEDIIPLMYYFKLRLENKYKKYIEFSPEIYEYFLKHDWPGNVRELQNLVERLFVTAKNSFIDLDQLNSYLNGRKATESIINSIFPGNEIIPLRQAKELIEKRLIETALKKFGSTYKVAKALGVNQSTIARKAKKLLSPVAR